MNNKFVFSVICVLVLGTVILFGFSVKNTTKTKVFLGGQEMLVTVADTPRLQKQGLSGVKNLEPNEGMLFVFTEPKQYEFWMKDMNFPIDIIYFDENRKIVDVWMDADPLSYPKVFTPKEKAQFVLEVQAGFFSKFNLKMGNIIEIAK